jgi:uncharacterized coiled-coil DUF342 family protein
MDWIYRKTGAEIREQMDALYREIDEINALPEEDVCIRYNVDCRSEAIDDIHRELRDLEEEHGYALGVEEREDAWLRRFARALTPTERAYISFGF